MEKIIDTLIAGFPSELTIGFLSFLVLQTLLLWLANFGKMKKIVTENIYRTIFFTSPLILLAVIILLHDNTNVLNITRTLTTVGVIIGMVITALILCYSIMFTDKRVSEIMRSLLFVTVICAWIPNFLFATVLAMTSS